jgi:glycosyltransferase involved in cell wall biosynthesis
MKICRVGTVPASLLSIRHQLVELQELGAQVTVICSSRDVYTPNCVTYQDLGLPSSLRHLEIEIPRRINLFQDLKALFRLAVTFRREKFEVVHSIGPKASLLVAVAGFIARTPVRLHTYTGQRWVTLAGLKRLGLKAFDALVAKLNTQVFADSPTQAKFLVRERISKRVDVIGAGSISGVHLQEFNFVENARVETRKALGYLEGDVVVVFAGRIAKDKGVHELLQAFESASKQISSLRLLLIGNVEPDIEKNLWDLACQNSKIKFLGFKGRLSAYLSASDFLVLPSYREGFGSIVIEAAALGVPTIGTNIYGLVDAIQDGVTGDLIEPRDAKALEEKLIDWATHPEKVKQIGQAAKKRVELEFDSRIITSKLWNRYQELAGHP